MKSIIVTFFAVAAVFLATACSSGARIGTRHHSVSVGGSIGR